MILDSTYLYDEVTTVKDSEILYNVKGTILVLQVKGGSNFSFKIKGSLDLKDDTFIDIASINMSSLEKATEITGNGIYQADISGCRKIKLSLTSVGSDALTVYSIIKEG